jgi:splicing factor 3A subunit 1
MVLRGVIRPPPEIRAVADRTALYVAKNGRAFEARIMGSEKGRQPKFSFLQPDSPFHSYYESKVQFYEEGGTDNDPEDNGKKVEKGKGSEDEKAAGAPPENPPSTLKMKASTITSVIDPVAKAVLAQRAKIGQLRSAGVSVHQQEQGTDTGADPGAAVPTTVTIPPPPPLSFVNVVAPSSLSDRQLELIQLVAQMTALDRTFLLQLSAREWSNPEFGFCQPRHGHFAYFSALVDSYRLILSTWTTTVEQQEKKEPTTGTDPIATTDLASSISSGSVEACLERAAYRAEYERDAEQQRRNQHQSSALDPVVVDWHDFVVVETIDFAADEVVDLSMLPPPPLPIPPVPSPSAAVAAAPRGGDEMDESDEEDQEQIRLVPNYQPRVVGSDAKAPQYVIDPITGKSVAVQDMPEHMRIQLLDPKWAEERKKFQDKQKDSNLVSGDVVASNLERLAQARGGTKVRDVSARGRRDASQHAQHGLNTMYFRIVFLQEHDLLTKESDSKKRLAEANRVIREQGQSSVGPFLPALAPQPQPPFQQQPTLKPPPAVPAEAGGAEPPPSKRPRVDKITMVEAPPLPTTTSRIPAPPSFDAMAVVPPIDPTTAALEGPLAGVGESALTPSAAATASAVPLLSESEFAASLGSPDVTLQVRIPNDRTQIAWNFYGQTVAHAANVMSTVKQVKQQLSEMHLNGMPPNKIQLKASSTGAFLKDNLTLAALNIGPTASLELVPRARGGRK